MKALVRCVLALGLASCAAEPRKPLEMVPIGTQSGVAPQTADAEGSPATQAADARVKDECLGAQFDNLERAFARSDCDAMPDSDLEMRGKLSIKATPDASHVGGGGHTIVRITITNDSQERVPVFFRLDPTPRFELATTDAKGRQVDAPTGKKPNAKEPDGRVARVTLTPGGTIKVVTTWEAVRRKWALRNGKPAAVPAGALPRGHYKVRVTPPLVGVRDMAEFQPSVEIDVGG